MNIDVVDIVAKANEQLTEVNWVQTVMTFVSVFFGAFWAHRFSLKLEMRKAHRQIRGAFCSLVSHIHLDFSDMLNYKKMYLDKIKRAYEERNMNSFLATKELPCMTFVLDIDRYIFLSDCNRVFLSELKIIKSLNGQLNNEWQRYMQAISNLGPLLQNGDDYAIQSAKTMFYSICETYDSLCVRVYYLNKHLSDCYERFFNVNYYDDFETDEQLGKEVLQCISQEMQKKFIDLSEYFDKYWAPDHTFWEDIKFNYRKLKCRLKCIKIYFFGRGKPQKECKAKGKK